MKKVKIGFWVEQCLHALFECQEDVNKIKKKNHTNAVSAEVCVIFLFCKNLYQGLRDVLIADV